MYNISIKSDAVKEIQKYLLFLSYQPNGKYLSHLGVDGIFGSETKSEVMKFQSKNGLSPTGVVDYITWQTLYSEFYAANIPSRPIQSI